MIIENEKDQIAVDCVLLHYKAFLKNFHYSEIADFGEPCKVCKHSEACNHEWLPIIKPLLDHSEVKISMKHPHITDTYHHTGNRPNLG